MVKSDLRRPKSRGNPYNTSMKGYLDKQGLFALRPYDQVRYRNKMGTPAKKGDSGAWRTSRGKSSFMSRTS